MTRNGALAGMVLGAATVLLWKQGGWFGLYEMVPGFIFASVAIVVGSLLGPPPSPAMANTFDAVRDELHQAGA